VDLGWIYWRTVFNEVMNVRFRQKAGYFLGSGTNICLLKVSSARSSSSGRAIAQAVSRHLPTPAARVRSQVRSCGIDGGQSGTGASFLRVLRFAYPVVIPPNSPYSSIGRGW
jgi:hypothetical protein